MTSDTRPPRENGNVIARGAETAANDAAVARGRHAAEAKESDPCCRDRSDATSTPVTPLWYPRCRDLRENTTHELWHR